MSCTNYSAFLESEGLASVPLLLVADIRTALADVAAHFYRGLLDSLTLVGFTGTKGKSSTTYMLRAILDHWLRAQGKVASGWLSGIENYDGAAQTRSLLTTPDVLELYTHLHNAVDHGIEYLTMEVSSQALKYHRTRNLWFEVAGFLNIGEDHISAIEHPDHEDYLASKLALFEQSTQAVINKESDEFERVFAAAAGCKTRLTFGLSEPADLVASDLVATTQGLSFCVAFEEKQEHFTLPMAGLFNVENALAALAAAYALGVPLAHMQQGLAQCQVDGRMQLIPAPDEKLVIVDYAHNKMSFETIFATVSAEYPNRPIVCVFGATGNKGSERRRELPAVAVQYAQHIYITEDDPGEEPLEQINQQIAEVVAAAGGSFTIIEDRDAAIAAALDEAPQGSVVLVLGKGHETLMKRGQATTVVPSDAERVQRLLNAEE